MDTSASFHIAYIVILGANLGSVNLPLKQPQNQMHLNLISQLYSWFLPISLQPILKITQNPSHSATMFT